MSEEAPANPIALNREEQVHDIAQDDGSEIDHDSRSDVGSEDSSSTAFAQCVYLQHPSLNVSHIRLCSDETCVLMFRNQEFRFTKNRTVMLSEHDDRYLMDGSLHRLRMLHCRRRLRVYLYVLDHICIGDIPYNVLDHEHAKFFMGCPTTEALV